MNESESDKVLEKIKDGSILNELIDYSELPNYLGSKRKYWG